MASSPTVALSASTTPLAQHSSLREAITAVISAAPPELQPELLRRAGAELEASTAAADHEVAAESAWWEQASAREEGLAVARCADRTSCEIFWLRCECGRERAMRAELPARQGGGAHVGTGEVRRADVEARRHAGWPVAVSPTSCRPIALL
jgi:hypothetical protein